MREGDRFAIPHGADSDSGLGLTLAGWRQEHPGYLAGEALRGTEGWRRTRGYCGQDRYGAEEQMDPARCGSRVLVLASVRVLFTQAQLGFTLVGTGFDVVPGCRPGVVVNRSICGVNPQLHERVGVREIGASPVIARQEDHSEQCQAREEL